MPYAFIGLNTKQISRLLALRLKYEKYVDRIKRCAFKRSLKQLFTNSFDRTIFVAEYEPENKIVGVAFISNFLEEVWSLDIIAVHPSYYRRGIGTQLIKKIKSYVKSRKGNKILSNVTTDNIKAIKLYTKLGFTKTYQTYTMELDV
jgi:ribosomal protein S18 acetylase RimI-like enzyme